MEWLGALLDALITPAIRALRAIGTFIRNNPWRTVRLGVGFVVAGALVTASWYAIGFFTAPVRVGGVDIVGFCDHHGFTRSSIETPSCFDEIDLDAACRWTYEDQKLSHDFEGETLYTARCVDAKEASRGGIDNMSGYCESEHATAVDHHLDVAAIVAGGEAIGEGTWICRAESDLTAVCRYNYPAAVTARQDEHGQWSCYAPKSAA